MALNLNWGNILGTLISEIIKILLPWTKEAVETLLEQAYELVERWAKEQKEKPPSTEKMEKAVEIVRVFTPELDPAEARILLEATHLEKEKA